MKETEFIDKVEKCLRKNGIDSLNQIEGMSIVDFMTKHRSVLLDDKTVAKLIDMGIIFVPEGEVAICQLDESQYLKNCLYRADMILLSDIRKIPEEKWYTIRNLGDKHRAVLLRLCDKYGVQIFRLSSIQEKMLGVRFNKKQLEAFFEYQVYGPEDLFRLKDSELEELIHNNKTFAKRINEVKRLLLYKTEEKDSNVL